jgi:hypothetical protein
VRAPALLLLYEQVTMTGVLKRRQYFAVFFALLVSYTGATVLVSVSSINN